MWCLRCMWACVWVGAALVVVVVAAVCGHVCGGCWAPLVVVDVVFWCCGAWSAWVSCCVPFSRLNFEVIVAAHASLDEVQRAQPLLVDTRKRLLQGERVRRHKFELS